MINIPHYQVIKQIYESSNSVVYRSKRTYDGLPVILKVLKKHYPTIEELARYHQEYNIIQELKEINGIIKIYDLEKYKNMPILCLEDVGGESLVYWLRRNVLTLTEQLRLAIYTTEILAQIHQHGIIHKDINPANIIWNPMTDVVKIIDFGISTQFSKQYLTLKNPNILEGTLPYMSPEQTGRMNRTIDYRSDFYSLGVTLYEMFTGIVPFDTDDAMKLVHCHLAKHPDKPSDINPQLPHAISNIITKLLAKTAEERYQSAWGIQADLQRCYEALTKTGNIETFELAQKDLSDHFDIPQKLYGREKEINKLLASFECVTQGQVEIMLVTGYSGIGKSVLVQEIYRKLTQKNGYFIKGKFDQLQHSVPYSAVISAFKELVQQLLTENSRKLAQWKAKLLKALGRNGQVIIDVIPEIVQIIGEQPPVPTLNAVESQNRFNLVFQNFIHVFCHPDHPLVIFLDDLQWVDSATIKLLKLIIEDKNNTALFLIGAYRDNEVSTMHLLTIMLNKLREDKFIINKIKLKPLSFKYVSQLVADSLHQDLKKVRTLTHLVIKKTQGNPFFINQFLYSLYEENLLHFIPPTPEKNAYWQWDAKQIEEINITDNVIDLMIIKLRKLPNSTQTIVQLAACMGNHFDLTTLAIVYEKSIFETFQDLTPLLMEDFLLPKSEPQLVSHEGQTELVIHQFQFLHDRVQQAAYALIDESKKKILHLRIGRLLLENTPESALLNHIFKIVEQLNHSTSLINNKEEKYKLAQLNLFAGQKAKLATAYKAAIHYFEVGRFCLTAQSWEENYTLTYQLFAEGAEAAYLSGDFQQMEALAKIILSQTHALIDEVRICEIQIQANTAQNKQLQAIKIALDFLARLDIHLPISPVPEDIGTSLQIVNTALAGRSIKALIDLPSMTIENKILAMRVMVAVTPAAYHASPILMVLLILKQTELSFKYGNVPESTFAYTCYGFILCSMTEKMEAGYQFGQLGLDLLNKLGENKLKARTIEIFNVLVRPWNEHITASFRPLLDNYQTGLEVGDLEFAAYSICVYSKYAYFTGKELNSFVEEIKDFTDAIAQLKQTHMVGWNHLFWQVSLNLLGINDNPCLIIGDVYDENVQLPQHQQVNDKTVLHYFYLHKAILNYLFHNHEQALKNINLAEQYLDGIAGLILTAIFYFYNSLIKLSLYPNSIKQQQDNILNTVAINQEKMQHWAKHAPMNFLHKYYLVEAEKARVLGHHGEAREHYDQAIELAEKYEYINEAALAYELAGQFYLAKKKLTIAQIYLRDAHYAYQQWGAVAKVKHLEQRYPNLIIPMVRNNILDNVNLDTFMMSNSTSSNTMSESLDLNSIIKASQTLSGEIVLSQLLEKMMQIVMENAGAEKGYLLLNKQGKWLIEAEIHLNKDTMTVLQSINVEEYSLLAINVLYYVVNMKESVVLDDATQEKQFAHDTYILNTQAKSILCMPLLNNGILNGILYLENSLIKGAFTPQRLEILNLLSSQLAISLQNALFYAELEEKVAERTQKLQQQTIILEQQATALEEANTSLLKLNQEKNEFLGIAAHDLKNPLQAIQGSAELIELTLGMEQFDSKEEMMEFASMIQTSSKRMFGLITNLLDVNAIESGQMKINLQQVNILPILQDVVDEYAEKALSKNITVHFAPIETKYMAYVDINTLHQILDNLISNAVKYSPFDKNIYIRIMQQDTVIRIEIQDQGFGLSQEDQAKLFGKFVRLTTKPTSDEHSTGLGLFIVKKLVAALRGEIWCESELEKGATFILTIPYEH